MALSSARSSISGLIWRQMFSVKVTLGASNVADAVDLMAESKAPKKITCITNGIFCITNVGSTR